MSFDNFLDSGKSVQQANITQWNSLFYQLNGVSQLDDMKLSALLNNTKHSSLILKVKEISTLQGMWYK